MVRTWIQESRTRRPSSEPVETEDLKKECADIHNHHDRSKDCASFELRLKDASKEPGGAPCFPSGSATRWQVGFPSEFEKGTAYGVVTPR